MHSIDLYDYQLPRERIAQEPLRHRADARLMVVRRREQSIEHLHVRDLPELIESEDTLVLNNSRVIPARLFGYRTRTGGRWQGLYLRHDPNSGIWETLTRTRGKLQTGETITLQDREGRDGMALTVIGRGEDGHLFVQPTPLATALGESAFDIETTGPNAVEVIDMLERFGRVPIPPYIRDGQMVDADIERYQTVYASEERPDCGSVAAPTAGLHFTDSLLKTIAAANTSIQHVTLHVGAGTFQPMEHDDVDTHQMHSEWGRIDANACEAINARRDAGGRCIAVGTTSVRVLESAAAEGGVLRAWTGQTDLFIKPPYQFLAVDALMTNFHLPKSSLLVLVSAIAGRELIRRAYDEAIMAEYRFFSYGDAMLIL
ncbi:MAG: tRNA preQ1(34) S-adenosylmethionine ribosyltransferase-isomerase QueA [Planctomycetota bacterium]